MATCRMRPIFFEFMAMAWLAWESVYTMYGFGQTIPKKRNMFSTCSSCLQQTLAATNSADRLASFSNYGAFTVDVAARRDGLAGATVVAVTVDAEAL